MKNLETLIQELCPDGVEFRTMEEVFEIRNGYTPSKNNPDFWEGGTIPWFRMEDIRQNGRILSDAIQHITPAAIKGKGLFPANSIIIATTATIGEHALVIADSLANQRFTNLVVRKSLSACLLPKFVFYYMFVIDEWCKKNVNAGNFASVDMKRFKKLEFPLPPIEVQTEIVRILDKFTSLEAELETEIEAEIDCRKRQYEYYRDKLLSFNNEGGQEVEWKKMSEVCEIYDGTHQTPKYQSGGIPFISVENIKDIYGSNKYISLEDYESYKIKPKVGDVFMTRIGSIGVCTVFTKQADIAYYVSLALLRPNKEILDSRYLKHFIESAIGRKELGKRILHNAVPIKINKSDIGKVKLLIPSLEEQHRIVSILDRFESLTTSLQSGLPAEISARRQQYEHYRDKLLTFKRKGAA